MYKNGGIRMKKEKLQAALNLSSSTTMEEFYDELLDTYIKYKEPNNPHIDVITENYQMTWGGEKLLHAEGISKDGKYIVILEGSDFAAEETRSLGQNYKDLRKELIDKGVVKVKETGIYQFASDYPFLSFSTAASVLRGVQLNGKKYFKPKQL